MLTYNNLSLKFHQRWIFENLSGSFQKGELIGIMGPNGSGKSSFLKCLVGLISPTKGEIFLHQKPLSSYSLKSLSSLRAYGRSDMECAWDLTTEEVLKSSANHSLEKIEAILSLLKSSALLGKRFTHLSGGERSLVILALVLLQETSLIMLDEITAMLDQQRAHHVMSLLHQQANLGKTIIAILHDKFLAEKYCHRKLLF